MCKFSSKSEGVPFQISFFLGDLTRNDPVGIQKYYCNIRKILCELKFNLREPWLWLALNNIPRASLGPPYNLLSPSI